MKFSIRDYEYEIIECGDDDERFYKDGTILLFGEADYIKQEIRLYKNLSFPRKKAILIHELTHAFINVYLGAQQVAEKFNEEEICVFLGNFASEIVEIANKYLAFQGCAYHFGKFSEAANELAEKLKQ